MDENNIHSNKEEVIKMRSEVQSEKDMSEEIIRMIISSVEKTHSRKSLTKRKRKRRNMITDVPNGSEADDEKKAYSRCSISYLNKVLQRVRGCSRYVELVNWMGFGDILELDDCCVPRPFVHWIADNVIPTEGMIKIGSTYISLSPQSVADTLGTPSGEFLVDRDEELGKAAFLETFGLAEIPSIKYFGKLILRKEILPDNVFCRCFMSVCLGTFLCPNTNTKLSTEYMGALMDVDMINSLNWSKFIHEWLMIYIQKFLKDPETGKRVNLTLGGCIYHLAVRCLDFIDFGCIQMPNTLPRIKVWKGKLIEVFSEMYLGTNGKFGAYPVKDISETCYALNAKIPAHDVITEQLLQQSIDTAIGEIVGSKLKQLISSSFVCNMKDQPTEICKIVEGLVLEVVNAMLSENPTSQETLKLTSSDNCSSHDTEKLPPSEECSFKTANEESVTTAKFPKHSRDFCEDEVDDHALIPRTRRRCNSITSPLHTEMPSSVAYSISSTIQPENIFEDAHTVCSPEHVASASLQHMLPLNIPSREVVMSDSVSSKDFKSYKPDRTRKFEPGSVDLNKNCIDEEGHSFSEVTRNCAQQENCIESKVVLEEEKDIDIHITNVQIVGSYKDGYVPNTNTSLPRSVILQQAMQKYYFKDSDTPSWRLLENLDENGKTIEEPELFRPIGMDDLTYTEKCEHAIWNCKQEEIKMVNSSGLETPLAAKEDNSNCNTRIENGTSGYGNSIQCAQKEPEITGLTDSPNRVFHNSDSYVDLYHGKQSIAGRRLFDDKDEADWNESQLCKTPPMVGVIKIEDEVSPEVQFLGLNLNNNIVMLEKSPEVQYIGQIDRNNVLCEKSTNEQAFKNKCNSMSRETDDLYNASFLLGNASSSRGKENWRPQRIPQRSKWTCSPYDATEEVTINKNQRNIWEAVTTLCDIEPKSLEWAIEIDNVKVSMLQLGRSFKINGWVEAWVINAFCRMLFRNTHPKESLKHFFFSTVTDHFPRKWTVESAAKYWEKRAIESLSWANKAKALSNSEGLYFPTIHGRHWFVMMVDMKYRNFIFLDSVWGEESTYHKAVDNILALKK